EVTLSYFTTDSNTTTDTDPPHPIFFRSLPHHPPSSTLFPYTTLFRSKVVAAISVSGPITRMSRDRIQAFAGATRRAARTIKCDRSEEHTSELQSRFDLVCRLLLEKKKKLN